MALQSKSARVGIQRERRIVLTRGGLNCWPRGCRKVSLLINCNLSRRDVLSISTLGSGAVVSKDLLARAADVRQAAVVATPSLSRALEDRVAEFTLPNGLHFLVLERRVAPVVSCHTYANVGAFNEEDGHTGLAHLLEHMAFKGTAEVGTKDYKQEAPLLDALDEAFYSLRDAKQHGMAREAALQSARLQRLKAEAEQLVVPNAFGALLKGQGAVGLNADTSQDATRYYTSLPCNRLPLWMALEAQRFRAPVWRQLYSEKEVVAEERRMSIDNAPAGRFRENFALTALSNNYRRPVIGFPADVEAFGRQEVADFHRRYYGPANLTIAVVGDVNVDQVHNLATQYFGDWNPTGYQTLPRGAEAVTNEGLARPQSFVSGELREYRAPSSGGPLAMLGYYRPPRGTPRSLALEVARDVLSEGYTARMWRELVQPGKVQSAGVVSSWPGKRHSGLSIVYGVPREGSDVAEVSAMLRGQLQRLAEDGPTDAELARVRKWNRTARLENLTSNAGMAASLCFYHAIKGSWRGLTEVIDQLDDITPADVRDAAQQVFAEDNCFSGYTLQEEARKETLGVLSA